MGNYGKIGGRRSRGSGAFQWLLIGFFPGLLCGGLVIFLLLLSGLGENFNFGAEPTPVVITEVVQIREIITTTPQEPMVVTATSEPTSDVPETSSIVIPTATVPPTEAPDNAVEPTPEPTTTTAPSASADTGTNAQAQSQSGVPPQLAAVASPMIDIQGGVFLMGTSTQEIVEAARLCVERDGGACQADYGTDSTPTVAVELPPYSMDENEVTFQQYIAFLNWLSSQGQRHTNACFGFICIQTTNENSTNGVITFDSANYNAPPGLLNHPVYGVTWYGAKAYCEALGRRLPSEAEWEYAAKGDAGFIYPWGNNWSPLNANTNEPEDQAPGTFPVTDYPTNVSPFGLRQMAGNVEEWVEDWYSPTYYSNLSTQAAGGSVLDPVNTIPSVEKVLRGGSWDAKPFFARTVHRRSFSPVPDSNSAAYPRSIGFRCASDFNPNSATNAGDTNVIVPLDDNSDGNAQPNLPDNESEEGTGADAQRG